MKKTKSNKGLFVKGKDFRGLVSGLLDVPQREAKITKGEKKTAKTKQKWALGQPVKKYV